MSLVKIVRDLERIKTNLPKYHAFPEITLMLLKKQDFLEKSFLENLEQMSNKRQDPELLGMYTNWYKSYKKIEFL